MCGARKFVLIQKRDAYFEGFAIHSARALSDEREEKMSTQFVRCLDLQVRIQEFAEALVVDVLKQQEVILHDFLKGKA